MTALRLDYAFKPDVVRTSQADVPNTIDLTILVSAPSWDVPDVDEIDIAIPTGADDEGSLQASPTIAAPAQPADPNWQVKLTGGGMVTLTTADGQAQPVTSLQVVLKGILVTEAQGTARVDVTETVDADPPGAAGSFGIVKWDEPVLVRNFRCDPPRLTGPGESGKLFWDATQLGAGHPYTVTDDQGAVIGKGQLDPASHGGLSITPRYGRTYTLTVAGGGKAASQVLRLDVPVLEVKITSGAAAMYMGGRIVALRWSAENAARCSVALDSHVIHPDAPGYTWDAPYVVCLPGPPAGHQLQVTAHGLDGVSEKQGDLYDVTVTSPAPVAITGQSVEGFDLTPDGSTAVVAAGDRTSIVDLTGGRRAVSVMAGGGQAAVMPGGKRAIVAGPFWDGGIGTVWTVWMVDLSTGVAGQPLSVQPPQWASYGALEPVPPDGRLVLTAFPSGPPSKGEVGVVDTEGWQVASPVGPGCMPAVTTGDGALVVAPTFALRGGGAWINVDPIGGGKATSVPVDAAQESMALAAGKGSTVLVAYADKLAQVWARMFDAEAAEWLADPLVVCNGSPSYAAFLPGETSALIWIYAPDGTTSVYVLDVARWKLMGGLPFPWDSVCVAANGTIVGGGGNELQVYDGPASS